jgi:hypothetical protein
MIENIQIISKIIYFYRISSFDGAYGPLKRLVEPSMNRRETEHRTDCLLEGCSWRDDG